MLFINDDVNDNTLFIHMWINGDICTLVSLLEELGVKSLSLSPN